MNIIRWIVDQGTEHKAGSFAHKYTRVTNWITLIVFGFMLQNMMVAIYFKVLPLLIIELVHCLLLCLVPILNRLGRRLLATALFSVVMILFVTIYALVNALDTNTIFYLPLIIFALFFLFPVSKKAYVFSFVGLVSICFVLAFTWHYYGLAPLIAAPPGFQDGQRWNAIAGIPFLSGAFGVYAFYAIHHAERETEREKEKAEQLLLNILPPSVAQRFKDDQSLFAEGFDSVTVLFADIVGFTRFTAQLPPDAVVRFLNNLFSEFDRLVETYGLEKIKTIGDEYMVAGGVPLPTEDHAEKICAMALDMMEIVRGVRRPDGVALNIRIGIHSGPVTAGVIGVKKFIYDLWGDTVNTASRMETHAEDGHIQVTEAVYRAVRADFVLVPRGPIEVKGKGLMETYYLTGLKGAEETERIPAATGTEAPAAAERVATA